MKTSKQQHMEMQEQVWANMNPRDIPLSYFWDRLGYNDPAIENSYPDVERKMEQIMEHVAPDNSDEYLGL